MGYVYLCIKNHQKSLLREFQDKLIWKATSSTVSIIIRRSFIREFQDKVYWRGNITSTRTLSEKFHKRV